MMEWMKTAFWGLLLLPLIACCGRTTAPLATAPVMPEAPCEIVAASIDGDLLFLTVEYGGGCAEHEVTVESAGPLMKSLPPKQPLRVVHRTQGDPCRALIQQSLEIDLKPWRGTPRGITVILLENWNEPLTYEYD